MNADELARACANLMWEKDVASKGLGMELGAVSQGRAQVTMRVREDMVNGHNICHGGFIFTLADSAFAFACNGYDQVTVAQHCTISFINSAALGDVLSAKAIEKSRKGRSGIYDVTVTNDNGEIIAEFRGMSRVIKGSHLPSQNS